MFSDSRELKRRKGYGMIDFWCRNCGKPLKANDEHTGKQCKCPKCGETNTIPVTQSAGSFGSSERVPAQPTESPKSSIEEQENSLSYGGPRPEPKPDTSNEALESLRYASGSNERASTTQAEPTVRQKPRLRQPAFAFFRSGPGLFLIFAFLFLLVFTVVVTWQLATRSASSTSGDRSANNPVWFGIGRSVRTRDKAGFSLQLRSHQDEIAGTSSAYLITNEDESPLTITRVVYNGEHEAGLAWWWEFPHPEESKPISPRKKLPVTLTIGESQYFMKYTAWFGGKFNYRKNVVFIDIFTNRGDFRYRDGVLEIKP